LVAGIGGIFGFNRGIFFMLNLTRIAAALGILVMLGGCTAAGSVFDNNCSGNGWIHPGADYCADYTDGP
jgi:hypothetical protein